MGTSELWCRYPRIIASQCEAIVLRLSNQEPRGRHYHLSVAPHRSMKTRYDTGRIEIVTNGIMAEGGLPINLWAAASDPK